MIHHLKSPYILLIFVGYGVFSGGYSVTEMYLEAWPYRPFLMSDRKTIAPMLIEIEDTPVHENPQANVKLFRTKVCPYQLENRVWVVREGRDPLKVADTSLSLSQPAKLGENKFTVNRLLNLIGEHEAPPPGPAYDEVRIGAKCNLVQMLFPNWGPGWIRTDFRFIE